MAKPIKPETETVRLCLLERANEDVNARLNIDKCWSACLQQMTMLYYPPFRAEDEHELLEQTAVGLEAYIEDLEPYPEELIKAAWKETRRAHKVERWPTIQAILQHIPRQRTDAQSGNLKPWIAQVILRLTEDQRLSAKSFLYGAQIDMQGDKAFVFIAGHWAAQQVNLRFGEVIRSVLADTHAARVVKIVGQGGNGAAEHSESIAKREQEVIDRRARHRTELNEGESIGEMISRTLGTRAQKVKTRPRSGAIPRDQLYAKSKDQEAS